MNQLDTYDKPTLDCIDAVIESLDNVIEGTINEAKFSYQKIAKIKPRKAHYENNGEKPYIKYICPICETLGNKHQVTIDDKNCPLCNVNLKWEY